MDRERVYCERCPIVNVCYGEGQDPYQPAHAGNCILAKLYYGEIKVKTTGYIERD